LHALSAPIRLSVYSATSPNSLVMFQRPNILSAVLLEMDIILTLTGGAQVDDLESPD